MDRRQEEKSGKKKKRKKRRKIQRGRTLINGEKEGREKPRKNILRVKKMNKIKRKLKINAD